MGELTVRQVARIAQAVTASGQILIVRSAGKQGELEVSSVAADLITFGFAGDVLTVPFRDFEKKFTIVGVEDW